jgi:hypothetical protein
LQLGENKMAKNKNKTADKTAQEMAQVQDATQAQPQGQAVTDLSIGDLKNLAIIIDVASTRGAFRANEMATVGVVYNKLQSFLARVAPDVAAPAAAAPAPAAPTDTAAPASGN